MLQKTQVRKSLCGPNAAYDLGVHRAKGKSQGPLSGTEYESFPGVPKQQQRQQNSESIPEQEQTENLVQNKNSKTYPQIRKPQTQHKDTICLKRRPTDLKGRREE